MHGTQSSRRDHQPSTPRFTLAYYDIEKRSELNLKKVGADRYATDESTEVRCVGYALDDGPVKLWTPDQPVPKDVADHIKRGDLRGAFNASFHWFDDEARAKQLHDYCTQDVRHTRELFNRLWQLSDEEQAVWETDQRINDRGFHVDEQLLRAMLATPAQATLPSGSESAPSKAWTRL